MSRLKLIVGDTRPLIYTQLKDVLGVIDVSNATVVMKFRASDSQMLLQTITGTLLPGSVQEDGRTPDLSQYPVAGSGGRVQFGFPPGALDVAPGYYEGEIEITYADGNVQTIYHKLKFAVREQF